MKLDMEEAQSVSLLACRYGEVVCFGGCEEVDAGSLFIGLLRVMKRMQAS